MPTPVEWTGHIRMHPTPDPDLAYTLWAAWLTHTAQEGTAHE